MEDTEDFLGFWYDKNPPNGECEVVFNPNSGKYDLIDSEELIVIGSYATIDELATKLEGFER